MLKPSRRHALALLLALASAGCTKDRSTFSAAWKAAVQAKDGSAAFALLDRASRDKVVAGLKKSQEKAAKDEAFKKLFADASAPADTTRAPELLAGALIAAQMADGKAELTDDGKTAQIHLDGGDWRVAPELVGFVDPDGAPITLRLRLPGAPPREAPAGVTSFDVHVPRSGKTVAEIHEQQAKALTRVAELAHLDEAYVASAVRVMNHFADVDDDQAIDRQFQVDRDGGITPVFTVFNRQTLGEQKRPKGKLAFGAWR